MEWGYALMVRVSVQPSFSIKARNLGVAAERIAVVSEDVSGGEVHGLFSLFLKRKYPRRPTAVNKN